MKNFIVLLGIGMAAVMAGCASRPAPVVAAVGPNPGLHEDGSSEGALQVYSRLRDESDDKNQGGEGISEWRQHTDYGIYNLQGQPIRHVENEIGHYAQAPERVTLPAGHYVVRARARGYYWVKVPVTIAPGLTTEVHLDDKWQPPTLTSKADLVMLPDGNPIGWKALPH